MYYFIKLNNYQIVQKITILKLKVVIFNILFFSLLDFSFAIFYFFMNYEVFTRIKTRERNSPWGVWSKRSIGVLLISIQSTSLLACTALELGRIQKILLKLNFLPTPNLFAKSLV